VTTVSKEDAAEKGARPRFRNKNKHYAKTNRRAGDSKQRNKTDPKKGGEKRHGKREATTPYITGKGQMEKGEAVGKE